jgi:Ca2+-binding RTX toxin-like protein
VLHIGGTKGADYIEVWEYEQGQKLAVRFNRSHKLEWYHLKGVNEIVIETGRGDDTVVLGNLGLPCSTFGGRGNDHLIGSPGADLLDGGLGDDTILGGNGNDTVIGGRGNDQLSGDSGRDDLRGGPGSDSASADDWSEVGTDLEQITMSTPIEIEPTRGMINRLKLLQDAHSATAFVEFVFPESGYAVTSVRATRDGSEIRIVVGIAEHGEVRVPAVMHEQRRIPLGDLPAGQYTFVVVSRGGEELARRSFDRV